VRNEDSKNYDESYKKALTHKNPGEHIRQQWGDPRPYYNKFVKPFIAGKDVLEIGAGLGRYTELATQDARSVSAIEVSEYAIAYLKQTYPGLTVYRMQDDILNKFDLIFSFSTFLHFNQYEMIWYMKKMYSMLQDSGRIVIHVMDMKAGEKTFTDNQTSFKEVGRYWFYTEDCIRTMLSKCKYSKIGYFPIAQPIVPGHAIMEAVK
jgi:SAM-dependent methyltransferase